MLVTAAEGMPSAMALRLFGPVELLLHGTPLPRLRTRKGDRLLALLVLRRGAEVERSWLAGLLWPNSSESEAYASLRVSLSHLRGVLGPEAGRLRSPTPHTLSLDLTGTLVDVTAFDAAVAQGDAAALEQAISLYRGPLLEGCVEEWAFQERQPREQAYLQALETLAAAAMTRGDPAAGAGYMGRVVAVDPLRESAQRGLMQALARSGNFAAALLTYRELRLRLHRELNTEPDPETQALFQQLRAEAREKAVDSGQRAVGSKGTGSGPELPRPTSWVPPHYPLPTGTVTFFLTDIEGSTKLWLQRPEAMRHALSRHDALAAAVIQQHEGRLIKQRGEGDSLFAVFPRATDAVAAAMEFQQALARELWPAEMSLQVRIALHTGEAELREGDYFGLAVNHCARLRAVGHGGQILLSQTTAALARDELPAGGSLRELGAHRLKDLQHPEAIFQLEHPELPLEFPPLRSLEAFAHNLPVQLTQFIGREEAISQVKRLLTATHLLTLTGAGGCGKTRLALQAAADLVEEYRDGVWLVELASLSDPGLVPQAVASTLGVREEPGRPLLETLTDAVRPRSLLLVLDNCEHLLPACAQLADRLLRVCPHLRILATSREPLRLLGEQTYRVPSLSVPAVAPTLQSATSPSGSSALLEFEAVGLFVDRARLSQPAFALTGANAGTVVELCQRLDGIPLAIELAAARVKALPLEKINERLDDMFRLLTGGSRTALPRQQTLQALIDWSYELLSEPERCLLRRLSVFAGGWNLEAAETVGAGDGIEAEEVIDLLTSLVEKSLVGYEEPSPAGGPGTRLRVGAHAAGRVPTLWVDSEARYRLLETVRQYAHSRLAEAGERASVRARHRDWFLALAERAEPELRRSDQLTWLDRLEIEHDNLRAALEWCRKAVDSGQWLVDSPVKVGANADLSLPEPTTNHDPLTTASHAELRLANALVWFWVPRNYVSEGRQCLEAALSRASEAPARLRIRALYGAGWLTHLSFGDPAAAVRFQEAGLDLARATNDAEGMALVLSGLAVHAAIFRDTERAKALAEESLVRARAAGDLWLIGRCLHVLGLAVCYGGERERAIPLFQESLAMLRPVGDRGDMFFALVNLGGAAQAGGDYEAARSAYREALICSHELRDQRSMVLVLECLAEVAVAQDRPQHGARLMRAAEGLLDSIGGSWPPPYVVSRERTQAALCEALGEAAFTAARAEGRAMPLAQAIDEALEEAARGSESG